MTFVIILKLSCLSASRDKSREKTTSCEKPLIHRASIVNLLIVKPAELLDKTKCKVFVAVELGQNRHTTKACSVTSFFFFFFPILTLTKQSELSSRHLSRSGLMSDLALRKHSHTQYAGTQRKVG